MATDNKPIVGTGDDNLLQGTSGADVIMGAAGNDLLFGLAGDDRLVGGVGDDQLDGGRGADMLSGGHGADLFVFSVGDVLVSLPGEGETEALVRFNLGHDVITDFQLGEDHLQVFAGSDPVVVSIAQLLETLELTTADVDGDGTLDTVINVDYIGAENGVHYTDPTTSITLLGVSGASIEQLFVG